MSNAKTRICPCCNNHADFRLKKGDTDYFQCHNCRTLFSIPLDNENMVGGGNEVERNTGQNVERIERFKNLLGRKNADGMPVLDFGCGNGYLFRDLIQAGFDATGFDIYNPEFDVLPTRDKFYLCSMIEVIEHLSHPFVELDCIHRSLIRGGFLYIETSFVDIAEDEGIPLEDFFYIEPKVGHATIFSHHGIDVLLALKGFVPFEHINRNVRVYIKK